MKYLALELRVAEIPKQVEFVWQEMVQNPHDLESGQAGRKSNLEYQIVMSASQATVAGNQDVAGKNPYWCW